MRRWLACKFLSAAGRWTCYLALPSNLIASASSTSERAATRPRCLHSSTCEPYHCNCRTFGAACYKKAEAVASFQRHDWCLLPAQLYAATLLNFHPSAYDAYGMTIVEAASQERFKCILIAYNFASTFVRAETLSHGVFP